MIRKIKKWLFLRVVVRSLERKVAKHDKRNEIQKLLLYMYMEIVNNNYDLKLQYRCYRIISRYLLS